MIIAAYNVMDDNEKGKFIQQAYIMNDGNNYGDNNLNDDDWSVELYNEFADRYYKYELSASYYDFTAFYSNVYGMDAFYDGTYVDQLLAMKKEELIQYSGIDGGCI